MSTAADGSGRMASGKFSITESTPESSVPPTPDPANDTGTDSKWLDPKHLVENKPPRSRSILNLTASTLFGIYSPAGSNYTDRDELNTPWGTGAQTPAAGSESPAFPAGFQDPRAVHRAPPRYPQTWVEAASSAVFRAVVLFGFGLAYGVVITHLHDNESINPVRMNATVTAHPLYLVFWGVVGIALGVLVPWVDSLMVGSQFTDGTFKASRRVDSKGRSPRASDWNSAVRSIGAFIGIVFAIRKLPWESTLQLSLTLTLINPVLWYIIDRTLSNFLISTLVGIVGTSALFATNENILPPPTVSADTALLGFGNMSIEQIWIATWSVSVLFCSCLCFGNIGRRLVSS